MSFGIVQSMIISMKNNQRKRRKAFDGWDKEGKIKYKTKPQKLSAAQVKRKNELINKVSRKHKMSVIGDLFLGFLILGIIAVLLYLFGAFAIS